jgi:hypothetical protein
VARVAGNDRTNRIVGINLSPLPSAYHLSPDQSGRWLVGAVGIELSPAFSVLPTASQMTKETRFDSVSFLVFIFKSGHRVLVGAKWRD